MPKTVLSTPGRCSVEDDGVLGGLHAADRGAVVVADLHVAGAHALEEGDPSRLLAVARPLDVPLRGAGGAQEPLQFDARDHVREGVVAVLVLQGGLELVGPQGKDRPGDRDRHVLGLLVVVDGVGLAELLADTALAARVVQAVGRVDDRHGRDGLRERDADAPRLREALIVRVGQAHGTLGRADAAAGALRLVHVARVPADAGGELGRLAVQGQELRVRQQVDVRVLADLDELWRKNAHGTIIGREGLVELGHAAADAGPALHEEDLGPGLRQVERGLDARDASADDKGSLEHGPPSVHLRKSVHRRAHGERRD